MKICYGTLQNLKYNKESGLWVKEFKYHRKGRKSLQTGRYRYVYVENCLWCNEPFLSMLSNVGKFCCRSCGIIYKQTGKPGKTKGRAHSKEAREKIGVANTGKKRTKEMKQRYSLSKLGKKNPMYGRTGKAHPMYGKTGANFKINLEAMYAWLRSRLKFKGLPYNKMDHPFNGVKRPDFSGKHNPGWKGGVTSVNESIRKSIEYKEWRTRVFIKYNHTCTKCGNKGGKLVVHHKVPLNYIIENNMSTLMFDTNNGEVMCVSCHKIYHKNNGYFI